MKLLKQTPTVLMLALMGCSDTAPKVAQPPPPPVAVATPLELKDREFDPYVGYIQAYNTVDIKSRVTGYLAKAYFKDGGDVKKNELLFEIDPRPYVAEQKKAQADQTAKEAQFKKTEQDFRRNERLIRTGGASQEEYDKALADKNAAAAAVEASKATVEAADLNVKYTKIRAPFAGRVSRPAIDDDNLVNADNTRLTTIVDTLRVYVYFDIDERSLFRYQREAKAEGRDTSKEKPIKELNIAVYVGLEGEEGYPHEGKLDFAEVGISKSTGTYQVRGILDNKNRTFSAGNRANVLVPIGQPMNHLMVTDRAINSDQAGKFVFVVGKDNIVKRRDVKLGGLRGGLRVIEEGLTKDDRVIVNGIQRVRPELTVEPHDGEMPDKPKPGVLLGPKPVN